MNTDPYTPDPVRVAIVQQQTTCTNHQAEQAIFHLDKYDNKTVTPETRSNSDNSGYASLPEVLPLGISALLAAGYGETESTFILQTIFNGLAAQHGGKRMYLPKPERISSRFENIQIF